MDLWQTCGGEQHVDRQFAFAKHPQLTGVHLRGADEQLEWTGRAQLLEIDLPVEQIAQGIQIERIELRGGKEPGPVRQQLAGWRQADRVTLALGHQPQG